MNDLRKLSRKQLPISNDASLLVFKREYVLLFEAMNAVFRLTTSNSRLCEQIHGMMRHGLRAGIGMDQADAQCSYQTSMDYEMKRERRDMLFDKDESPAKKTRKGDTSHNKNKQQLQRLSQQLIQRASDFANKARSILAEPNHGVPTIVEVNKNW